ncbi:hypothetical protein GJ496_007615 [Pomphorhynchus laevis]|nr:hypothetical protein GJ496_007615 [Pomphorhynchus laevis]
MHLLSFHLFRLQNQDIIMDSSKDQTPDFTISTENVQCICTVKELTGGLVICTECGAIKHAACLGTLRIKYTHQSRLLVVSPLTYTRECHLCRPNDLRQRTTTMMRDDSAKMAILRRCLEFCYRNIDKHFRFIELQGFVVGLIDNRDAYTYLEQMFDKLIAMGTINSQSNRKINKRSWLSINADNAYIQYINNFDDESDYRDADVYV